MCLCVSTYSKEGGVGAGGYNVEKRPNKNPPAARKEKARWRSKRTAPETRMAARLSRRGGARF